MLRTPYKPKSKPTRHSSAFKTWHRVQQEAETVNRNDLIGLTGLVFFIAGIGGGIELTLAAQSQAYDSMARAGGNANPAMLAMALRESTIFLRIGIAVAMLGVVLFAIALRGYLRSIQEGYRFAESSIERPT